MEKVEKLEVPDKKAHLHHEPIHHAVLMKDKNSKFYFNSKITEPPPVEITCGKSRSPD